MSANKSVSVTLPKSLAERLSLLRCFSRRRETVNKATLEAMHVLIVSLEEEVGINEKTWRSAKRCPSCSSGMLIKRQKKRDPKSAPFYGCVNFPNCKHKEKFTGE